MVRKLAISIVRVNVFAPNTFGKHCFLCLWVYNSAPQSFDLLIVSMPHLVTVKHLSLIFCQTKPRVIF